MALQGGNHLPRRGLVVAVRVFAQDGEIGGFGAPEGGGLASRMRRIRQHAARTCSLKVRTLSRSRLCRNDVLVHPRPQGAQAIALNNQIAELRRDVQILRDQLARAAGGGSSLGSGGRTIAPASPGMPGIQSSVKPT